MMDVLPNRELENYFMDDDLVLIISATCIKAARDIGDLVRLIPSDKRDLKIGIASTVNGIYENIIDPIFDEFPTLKDDMERRLAEYGRLI